VAALVVVLAAGGLAAVLADDAPVETPNAASIRIPYATTGVADVTPPPEAGLEDLHFEGAMPPIRPVSGRPPPPRGGGR
jgi:hypothetical protein